MKIKVVRSAQKPPVAGYVPVDDHRGPGEYEVGVGQPHREQGDSLLPGRARARAATRLWPRRLTSRLVLAGALSAFACTGPSSGPAPAAAPPSPITLTIGIPQSRQIDPDHGVPVLAGNLAFERLTTSDTEGRTQPRLLEGWSVSGDGLTWRLFVRPGVKFQDGSPLTAHDVKRTFDEVLADPNSREPEGLPAERRVDLRGQRPRGGVHADAPVLVPAGRSRSRHQPHVGGRRRSRSARAPSPSRRRRPRACRSRRTGTITPDRPPSIASSSSRSTRCGRRGPR